MFLLNLGEHVSLHGRVKVNPGPPKKRVAGWMLLVRWSCPGQPGDVPMLIVIKPKKKAKQLCRSFKNQV